MSLLLLFSSYDKGQFLCANLQLTKQKSIILAGHHNILQSSWGMNWGSEKCHGIPRAVFEVYHKCSIFRGKWGTDTYIASFILFGQRYFHGEEGKGGDKFTKFML